MKILIADDSPVIRSALSTVLADAGYDVVTADDGIETIQMFYAERPDLVVLDLQMPRMTGYMACRMLKDDWTTAQTPVLILSAHDSAEDRYWAEKSGADRYLTKESLGDGLVEMVKEMLVSRALSELSWTQAEPAELEEVDVLSRLTEMLDRKLFESTIANDVMTLTARSYDLEATVTEILFIVRRFVGYDVAAISVASDPTVMMRPDRAISPASLKLFSERATLDLVDRMSARVDPMSVRVVVSEEPDSDAELDVGDDWPSVFSTTLRLRNEVVGTLTLASSQSNAYGPQVASTLRTVETPVATVVDSALHRRRRMQETARQSLSSLYSFEDEEIF